MDDRVKTECGKLSSKKNLKKAWEDRGADTCLTTGKIIDINLEHSKKLEESGKIEGHEISKQTRISDRNLVIESAFTNWGFDPVKKTLSHPVEFTKDPSVVFKRFEILVVQGPN